ncbi:hypothetical protein POF51_26440 [Brevibacillus sp. AG]|uniref:hypothetical protein n=1 Tax=Brevibacillus sp. AG TaxID=3020891 RepID=UPI00232D65FD|nr:hypothetical protein [Brevibacillus sp. AG]MDC0764263.1 hypothetical protein [Brevibacillus sp. AG]
MNQNEINRRRNEWNSRLLLSLDPQSDKPIILSHHLFEKGRGYSKRDIACCFVSGDCIGWSDDTNQIVTYDTGEAVIVGRDASDQQMVIIVADTAHSYVVVTAFPPLDERKYGCSVVA